MRVSLRMNRIASVAVIYLIAFALAVGAISPLNAAANEKKAIKGDKKMAWSLKTYLFKNGERIPDKYTGVGIDVSPELFWDAPPAGTQELVLIMDDPDAPVGLWTHWIVYGMPPERVNLPESIEKKTEVSALKILQGTNTWPREGYWGPMPPPGKPHRYYFKLYALNKKTGLPPGANRKQIDAAIKGHIISETQLMGIFSR